MSFNYSNEHSKFLFDVSDYWQKMKNAHAEYITLLYNLGENLNIMLNLWNKDKGKENGAGLA